VLKENLEDSDVYLTELSLRTVSKRAQIALLTLSDKLSIDPLNTIQKLILALSDLHRPVNTRQSFFDADALARFEDYLQKRIKIDNGESIGIPTGLGVFDKKGDTWKPGEVVGVYGPLNTGKSWLLIYFAAYAYYYSNAKVLFMSPENTISDINARLDPVIGRFMGYTLSNRGIRNGTQEPKAYEKYLREIAAKGRKDFIIRDSGDKGAFTIDDITSLMREYKPDLVFVDGFHLISNGGKTWENMKSSAEQIKGLAQYQGCTVIAGSQVKREAVLAADETAELGQEAYGMGLSEAANRVISLAAKRGVKDQRIFRVVKHRDGEQILTKQYLHFDVDTGNIFQIMPDFEDEIDEVGEVQW